MLALKRSYILTVIVPIAMAFSPSVATADGGTLHDPREVHLAEVRQMTFGGENAEAYWSFAGDQLVYQASGGDLACDQIFRLDPAEPGARSLVSTGRGRTTCAYFLPGDRRVIYASTHFSGDACPPPPDRAQGYVWPVYASYEIVSAPAGGAPAGTDELQRLTDNEAYDAEATVCPIDGSIVFTSSRDGDLDLYRMNADGSGVTRLTDTPGYDGGAFFNHDCSEIVWRASRPAGAALDDYRRLLAEGLVRPGKLEIFVANADGSDARQVTYLGGAAFAPFFHPAGDRILFSSNHHSESGREFDVFMVRSDGSGLEQITFAGGFDGFPMFSPDGRFLAFSSNRNQGRPGETDVYVARWVETPAAAGDQTRAMSPADRFRSDVAWLADDQRQGRGVGTGGIEEAAAMIAERFAALGLEPGGDVSQGVRSYFQDFEVAVSVLRGAGTALAIGGTAVAADDFVPAGFSASGRVEAEVVDAGYGIRAPELDHDDYAHLDASGKIVLVRRFVPDTEAFADDAVKRRFGDLRYKTFQAREHGAVGMIVVDLPVAAAGAAVPDEAPLPRLSVDAEGNAGLPAVIVARRIGQAVLEPAGQRATLEVALEVSKAPAHNVVARLPAAAGTSGGPLVIGAHYDHLGLGGRGSLAPDAHEPHNGADDNASGTAALLEIGRLLAEQGRLGRAVWLVAFSGEESGLLGSTHFAKSPPADLALGEVAAMINLDMVGRLREKLSVLGAGSAEEWHDIVEPACADLGLTCFLGGDGYGPSDQTPFYAAGIPVLHLFTGTHEQYHRPTDDTALINAAGGARVAALAAAVTSRVAAREGALTYVATEAPAPQGDTRSYGASLGTIPDYADDAGGVLLAGVRPGSAAAAAGMLRGDRLVGLAGKEIGDIYDFMYILRESKPGQTVAAVVERSGQRLELEVTFGGTTSLR